MSTVLSSPAHRLVAAPLDALGEIDRVIFGSDDPFALGPRERDEFQVRCVRRALCSHRERNGLLAAFFERRGFDPERVESVGDLARVPLLPTDVFKLADVRSVAGAEIVRRFTSSGTGGAVSCIGRDDLTLERLIGGMRVAIRLLEPWLPEQLTDDDLELVNLGPSREDGGDVWFSYVMALADVIAPTRHVARGGTIDFDAAARDLAARVSARPLVGLVGPPMFVLRLIETLARLGLPVDGGSRLLVITGGGWKRNLAEALDPPAFRRRVAEAFRLRSEEQVRDAFNQVELNSIFFECAHHRKHVPPWVYAAARAQGSLDALPDGQSGLLSYLDASAHSYPCFIVTDDVGAVQGNLCPCGRSGPTIVFERRITRSSHEGCSRKMQRLLADGAEQDRP